jgi:hypothetical protein
MSFNLISSTLITEDNRHSHTLKDELYYFEFMKNMGMSFKFYTSEYMINYISGIHKKYSSSLINIEKQPIKINKNTRNIFMGYVEIDIFKFILKNFISKPKLVLIATNNFSKYRVSKYKWPLRFFLVIIKPFLVRIIVHSLYEKELILKLNKSFSNKILIKKSHLMTPKKEPTKATYKNINLVTFLGPCKHDKKIEPFIDLIKNDHQNIFRYFIHGVDKEIIQGLLPDLKLRNNINISSNKKLSDKDYKQLIIDSKLIFFGHTASFEGKISGNFCDCITTNTPFISRPSEPLLSYAKQYGPIGFFENFDDNIWSLNFLKNYQDNQIEEMSINLKLIAKDHSLEEIKKNLVTSLIK